MPVASIGGVLAFVRLEIRPSEVPGLLRRHSDKYPGANELEVCGANLIRAEFPPGEAAAFVRKVCEWGRGHRLVGRVLRDNAGQRIGDVLREGYVHAQRGFVGDGVEAIRQLRYLGQSFASKQLRFLTPTHAVILDEVIRSALGYAETAVGYTEFLEDCQALLRLVRATNVEAELGMPLRIADIEAAVFAKIQGY